MRYAVRGRPDYEPFLLGKRAQAIASALATWALRVIETAPPEPSTEVDFHGISIREWRRALDQWCRDPFVRRAHGVEAIEGLRAALMDFEDDVLFEFLRSLV